MEWVSRYGGVLRELAEEQLHTLDCQIEKWSENLMRQTPQIEDLKFVLLAIGGITLFLIRF